MAEDVRVKLWLDGSRRFAAQVKSSAREVKRLGREFKETNRDARKSAGGLGLVGRTMGLIKPAALITGLGLAAGGLSAVAAGAVGVVGALAPLVGVVASYGAAMIAMKTSMALVRVAGMGLSSSMKGVFDEFEEQTPATNAFARTVKGLVPELLSLKNAVQGQILGGAIRGIRAAQPLIGQLTPSIKATANALGVLAERAGLTAGAFGGQLARIMQTNVGLIRNVGEAAITMGAALIMVLDAARPLTTWVGQLAKGWAAAAYNATFAATKSGALAAFFGKTQRVLSSVLGIIGNLARGLFNVGRAAGPMGKGMLDSLDAITARFARFTGSVEGKIKLSQFFAEARPVVREMMGLIGDMAASFARLSVSSNGGLAPLLAKIRTLVPILERVVMGTTAAFGPALVGLITALAVAFEPLAGSSGPLVLFVQGLTKIAEATAWVAQNVPGGSAAISTLFGVLAVSQAIGLASFASGLMGTSRGVSLLGKAAGFAKAQLVAFNASTLGTRIGLAALAVQERITTVATTVFARATYTSAAASMRAKVALFAQAVAARASAVATGVAAVATRGFAAAQRILNFVLRANPLVRVGILLVALGAALVLAYRKSQTFRNIVTAAFNGVKSAASSVGGAFRGIYDAASRVVSGIANRFRELIAFVRRVPGAIGDIIKSAPGAVGKIIGGAADIAGLATGGVVQQAGWAVVGERGPELLRLPGASTVFDAGQTAMALPAPAAMRTPRVRTSAGGGRQEVEVFVRHAPIPVTFRDEIIGEATGRAVATHTARRR